MNPNKKNQEFNDMAKIAIIGDSGVGKTNLLIRYMNSQFNPNQIATIGIDFKIKTVTLSNNYKLKLQIWDTAGQQRFRNLSSTIYQGAQAIILVYSISSRKSLDNVKVWISDIQDKVKDSDFVLAIIGNKCDLEIQREVSREQGAEIATKYGAKIFMETSAKQNKNITEIFYEIAEKIRQKISKKSMQSQGGSSKVKSKDKVSNNDSRLKSKSTLVEPSKKQSKIKLQTSKQKQNKKGCC